MENQSRAKKLKRMDENAGAITGDSYINNLPPECLFYIFSFLTIKDRLRSSAVCKKWRSFGSEAWRDVKKLDLIAPPWMKVYYRRLIALCGKTLNNLTIPVPSCYFEIIRVVIENCSKLVKFRVQFQYKEDDEQTLGDDLAKLFKENRATLRSVIMDFQRRPSGFITDSLVQLPEELIELQLRAPITRSNQNSLPPDTNLILVIEKFKNLQKLAVNGFGIENELAKIGGQFEHLRYLEIDGNILRRRLCDSDVL